MYQHFLNLLFPDLCVGCNALLLHQEQYLCTHCIDLIDTIPAYQDSFPELMSRFYGKIPLKHALAWCFYTDESIAKQLIHHLKYKNQPKIGAFIAEKIYLQFQQHPAFREINEIVPVPLHPKKQKKRGYNQLDCFGQRLSELFHIPYNPNRLRRNYYNKSQTKKSIFNRSASHQNLFSPQYDATAEGFHFLLIDDVVTTGSTIEKAGNELLSIKNAQLSILTIAYAR